MAILNFPDAAGQPIDGSFTYEDNGVLYSWDGYKWNANSEQAYDDKYVEVTGDTMTGDLTVPNLISEGDVQTTSLNGGPLAGFRNQLINGDLRVWQRDNNFYNLKNTDRQYTSDRWQFFSSNNDGSAGFHVNRDDETPSGMQYSARITNAGATNAGGYGSAIFEQKVEGLHKFSNSTWTLSCYVKAGGTESTYFNLQAIGSYGTGGSPSAEEDFGSEAFYSSQGDISNTVWKRVSFTFTVSDLTAKTFGTNNDSFLRVGLFGIGLEGSQNFKVCGFQLEPGPVATPFEQRPIGTELALCQRYYQTHSFLRLMAGASDSPWRYATYVRAVQMRAAPTSTGTWPQGTGSIADKADTIELANNMGNYTDSIYVSAYTADAEL